MWKWFRDFLGLPPRPQETGRDVDAIRRLAHGEAVARARRQAQATSPTLEELRRAARAGRSNRVVGPTSEDLSRERYRDSFPGDAHDFAFGAFTASAADWVEPPAQDVQSMLPETRYVEDSPRYEAPAPSYEAPAPSYEAPAPSYEAPAPSYEAPAPSYEAPAPSPSYDNGSSSSSSYDGGGSSYSPD